MKKQSAAVAAALFASFISAADVKAQEPNQPHEGSGPRILIPLPMPQQSKTPCGPHHDFVTNWENNLGEKIVAMGFIQPRKPDTQEIFQLFHDKEGNWTILRTDIYQQGKTCPIQSGDNFKLLPNNARHPGLPVSLRGQTKGQTALQKIEQSLIWNTENGGQSLQMSGRVINEDATPGPEFRLYANTSTSDFAIVLVKDDENANIVAVGKNYVSPEMIVAVLAERKSKTAAALTPVPQ